MTPVQMNQLFLEISEKIVQATCSWNELPIQFSCIVPEGSLAAIHEYTARVYDKPIASHGNMTSVKYHNCLVVSEDKATVATKMDNEVFCDKIEQAARHAAYQRAHKLLDLHEMGLAVREYCMPEDEYRFVWHGKRYRTTSNGIEFTDTAMVQGEVCISYSVLKKVGEVA